MGMGTVVYTCPEEPLVNLKAVGSASFLAFFFVGSVVGSPLVVLSSFVLAVGGLVSCVGFVRDCDSDMSLLIRLSI